MSKLLLNAQIFLYEEDGVREERRMWLKWRRRTTIQTKLLFN